MTLKSKKERVGLICETYESNGYELKIYTLDNTSTTDYVVCEPLNPMRMPKIICAPSGITILYDGIAIPFDGKEQAAAVHNGVDAAFNAADEIYCLLQDRGYFKLQLAEQM